MDKEVADRYEVVIGLEVHAQLLTQSKAYSSDSAEYGGMPNTNIGVISLAHPGTLPRINMRTVEYAVKMGLACNMQITKHNIFDRKNYFYPDLPKGYQITQDKTPICEHGLIHIKTKDGKESDIRIQRIHMEEDSGKSLHLDGETDTLVDLNRAGIPLIEIVTEPDLRSSDEAYAYLTEIRRLVRYLEICDGNMEEGSLRCDANVSVRKKGAEAYGTRVEVKNMNSISNVKRAIEYEAERHILALENGTYKEEVLAQTRMFDAASGKTFGMRMKETMNDYRYFPEPDLPPLEVTDEYVNSIRAQMPSLPHELRKRFTEEYALPEYDAEVLTDKKETALYFEALCKETNHYKAASNWVMGPVKSFLNERAVHIEDFPITPSQLSEIIGLIEEGKVSFAMASQRLFPALADTPGGNVQELAKSLNIIQDSDEGALTAMIDEVLAEFPEKAEEYRGGKKGLLGMFMGQIMKRSKGKADPKKTNQLLRKKLDG